MQRKGKRVGFGVCAICMALSCLFLTGCGSDAAISSDSSSQGESASTFDSAANDVAAEPIKTEAAPEKPEAPTESEQSESEDAPSKAKEAPSAVSAQEAASKLDLTEDMRPSLSHGEKDAVHQRYIVLHDTEGDGSPSSVVDWWDSNGNLVAAHFVVGKDGSIVQCVPLDEIAHHAGYGDTGHNEAFDITEDGRDDMKGSAPIGDWASDYAMNAWSVGIEMVHVGGEGDYPQEQLEAVDNLIAYIDAYFGFESEIIDHKAWRSGNSDTSEEFAGYLANYQDHRTHA